MKKRNYLLFLFSCILISCDDASEDDLTDVIEGNSITYEANVKPIIDNNCISCHNNPPINGASTSLISYDDVRNSVGSNNLINRISTQAGGSGAMPLGGPRLPQNLIDIIIQWESNGFLED